MIVAGFGFRASASLESLRAALALAQQGAPTVTRLATAQAKAATLAPLAQALGLPLAEVTADALAARRTHTESAASRKAHGTGSVAESAALAAAGSGARLLRRRQISPDRMATCAIAQGIPE
ncbi:MULTISPECIES: cobalamin biosynthesis protein [unclassified Novosphingobium]|uniref:cobalamin biosynthesis protein n=1 Tax=unclassified Novosphingobium TaxID=2644732 RepID=UPI00187E1B2D|nr:MULTISPECIES: cobalamin biosynthesis protein [unclassified Novosphingobium]MCW1384539.1 cobalamin biosynthesis protein [Novosphingobium sp. KCTC 2891]QOV96614.1 cobalamin biosynthesis protein [Novosphingobium sp. ES2-1]